MDDFVFGIEFEICVGGRRFCFQFTNTFLPLRKINY
jgi:hypothetical protein